MPSCRSATKLCLSYKDSHQFHLKHNVFSCFFYKTCVHLLMILTHFTRRVMFASSWPTSLPQEFCFSYKDSRQKLNGRPRWVMLASTWQPSMKVVRLHASSSTDDTFVLTMFSVGEYELSHHLVWKVVRLHVSCSRDDTFVLVMCSRSSTLPECSVLTT